MEAWCTVFREGFLPGFSDAGLEALREALAGNDPRLIQQGTTRPPPLMCVQDWPCEAADAVGWPAWQGGRNPACLTVGDVEEAFARACHEADARVGEEGGCRWFLNFWDDGPRDDVFRRVLAEVEFELTQRRKAAGAQAPADVEILV